MKQTIVIDIPINEEKNSCKAMKLASKMKGVTKIEVMKDKNQLVVAGNGVDSVELAKNLRKRFCYANIVSIRNSIMPRRPTFYEEARFLGEAYPPQIRWDVHRRPSSSSSSSSSSMGYPVYDLNQPTTCSIM